MPVNHSETAPVRVSVIAPVYGVESFAEKFARSLFSQTWPHIQYIIVDDCSPDRSMRIIRRVLSDEFPYLAPRVQFIGLTVNGGVQHARLEGLRHADGDYVLQIDSDDWLEPDCVEALASKAAQTDADVVCCGWFREFSDGRSVEAIEDFPDNGPEFVGRITSGLVKGYTWNKLVRRSLVKYDSMYIPSCHYFEDKVAIVQAAFGARSIVTVPRPLYHYRVDRPGAVSRLRSSSSGSKRASGLRHNRAWRLPAARNLLELYDFLAATSSDPGSNAAGILAAGGDDILLQAGWYCTRVLDRALLRSHPAACRRLASRAPSRGSRTPLVKQLLTRLWCRFC